MPFGVTRFADDDHHHVPALPDVSVPSGEEVDVGRANTSPDGIGAGEHLCQLVPVSWQQVGMVSLDVALRNPTMLTD